MAWFKVDDKMHSHIKAAKAGVEALGLWVLCGSWSADQLTDGFVPDYIALRLDPKARGKASRLVAAGLWEVAEKGNDKGWMFHDWADMQPTRDDVEARREQEREKKRKWREKASQGADGRFTSADDAMSPGASPRVSPGDAPGSPEGCPPVSRPDPTRPDPTRPLVVPTADAVGRARRLPPDWKPQPATIEAIRRELPNLDIAREHVKFSDHFAANGKPMKDWDATWRNWMRRATEYARPSRPSRQQETDDLFAAAARRMGVAPPATHPDIIEGAIA